MKETSKSIRLDDSISFFNSLSNDKPEFPPVNNSLCVNLVYGVIILRYTSKSEK